MLATYKGLTMGDKKKLDYFQTLMQQILTLSTGGIAAGVAFLQVSGISNVTVGFLIGSIVFFVGSLVCGVWGLMAIIGLADKDKPDFNQSGVRGPNLIAVLGFGFGIFTFLSAAFVHYFTKPIDRKVEQTVSSCISSIDYDKSFQEQLKSLNKEQQLLLGYFIEKAFQKPIANTVNPSNPVQKGIK